ncbi:MAG: tRNA adenosine(34) deaminase TadA [Endomicrobium sp.]|jgi:tRNA(adenine34) deaminase|nr:tRNA adenosine(34) deaminase TadA [Endomicrobium sp.]
MKLNEVYFMSQALKEARKAQKISEVPIGAVITCDDKIIARGFNKCVILSDPTAHAEIVTLRKAAKKLKNYRLKNCSIYVTIEPCIMCVGALVNARIKNIIFGAYETKSGACKSVFKIAKNKKLNHKIEFSNGKEKYLNKECADIIKNFFKERRKN